MSLADFKDDIETCFGASCGFCERKCPVYQVIKKKTFTSRGRNRAILGLIEGKVKPSKAMAKAYFACMLCGCCERWCALPDTEIERELRKFLVEEGFEIEKHKENVENVMKFGNPYGVEDSTKWREGIVFASPKETHTLFFAGCTMPLRQPETLKRAVQLLGPEKIAIMDEEICCGSYVLRTGYEKQYNELTSRFLKYLVDNEVKEIITACPGCNTTIKEKLEKSDSDIKVTHIIQKLVEMLEKHKLTVKKMLGKVTYHDPCHLGRLEGLIEEPREILRQISDFREMPNYGYDSNCCGAGGGVRAAFPELSFEIGKKRIEEVKATGAEILVSSCPFCEEQFRNIGGIKVMDLIDAVWETVK
ncbi:MAG: (Fe-S)-binding protein [Methanomassiliicoccales archaeon]|nr:MAG: (Fe-S)-binding protein [Methanomassiliicoccales archaeon]